MKLEKYKPDAAEAARRWEAYWAGEVLDRPLLKASAPKQGYAFRPASTYYERMYGDLDRILEDARHNAAGTLWLGEQMPAFWVSLGTHELANYMNAEIVWPDRQLDTCSFRLR